MSDVEKKSGCLSVIVGLWMLFFIIYIPAYFIFFDSAEDRVLNSSLLDAIRLENRLIDERPNQTKVLDKIYHDGAKEIERRTQIDISKALKKVLKDNGKIQSLKCYSDEIADISTITIEFMHAELGNIRIVGNATNPSFIKIDKSIFLGFDETSKIGNRFMPTSLLIAIAIYGFDKNNIELLKAFQDYVAPRLPTR